MIVKNIECEDFDGNKYVEVAYFNLTKTELAELQLGRKGGLEAYLKEISDNDDTPEMLKFFKELIFKAYGVKSADGRRLEKSEQLSKEFSQTNAYDALFIELASDPDNAAKFFKGVIPKEMADQMNATPVPPVKKLKKIEN